LSIENEEKLYNLHKKLKERGITTSSFYEPDMDNQLTGISFEGTPIASKLVSSLPLALKGFRNDMLIPKNQDKEAKRKHLERELAELL